MQTLAPTTELDAVNILLGTIGESPITSLGEAVSQADVAVAQSVLREITITVESEGWHFNTEVNWPLIPTTGTNEIPLPANCIEIDTVGVSRDIDVAIRGARLYNRTNRTYTFPKTIYVDMTLLLPFEELPQAARNYITIRAARVFQQRTVGSDTLGGFTQRDENFARSTLKRFQINTSDTNFLTGSQSVNRILNR